MREVANTVQDLTAVIGKVRTGAVKYREEKYLLAAKAQKIKQALTSSELKELTKPLPQPSIAPANKHPQLRGKQREIIDGLIQCTVDLINKRYPLLKGEVVESDFTSYITKPYLDFPVGTAVIKRTTNMAEIYYFITNVLVDKVKGDLLKAVPNFRMPRLLGSGGDESFATTLGKSVLTGMASAIGGAIANYIIGQIFPPDVPSYFDKVYEQIASIIGKAFEKDKIDSINGALNTIASRLRDEYAQAREQSNLEEELDRKNLFDLLQKYDVTFLSGPGGMLGTLQSERYSRIGFAVFILGANLQLALFQEMANVVLQKKDGKWLSPDKTSYGKPKTGTLAVTAKQYAEYAEKTWPKVIEARLSVIDYETFEANKHIVSGDVYWELWGKIVDNGNVVWPRKIDKQAEKDGSYPSLEKLKQDLQTYKNQVRTNLTLQYSDPKAIAQGWRNLVEQPIKLK